MTQVKDILATTTAIDQRIEAAFVVPELELQIEGSRDSAALHMELRIAVSDSVDVDAGAEIATEPDRCLELRFGATHQLHLIAAAALSQPMYCVLELAPGGSGGSGAEYTVLALEKPDKDDAATYVLLRNGAAVGDKIHIPFGGQGVAIQLNTEESESGPKFSISLLDRDGNVLSTTDTFSGGGGAGITMLVTRRKASVLSQFGSAALLELSFTSKTADGSPTGNGSVAWYADSLQSSPIYSKDIQQSTSTTDFSISLDVSPWITSAGVRTFYAIVTDSQGNTRTVAFSVESIIFAVSNRYPQNTAAPLGRDLDFRYALDGGGSNVKYIHFTLDGVTLSTDTITTTDTDNISKIISTEGLTHGAHRLIIQGEIRDEYGDAVFSNTVSVDLITVDSASAVPIVSLQRETVAGQEATAKVYETLQMSVVVYVPRGAAGNEVKLRVDGETVTYIRLANLTVYVWNYTIEGLNPALVLSAECAGVERSLPPIAVTERVVDVDEAEIGLALKLAARGRTNSAPDRAEWIFSSELYGSYAAQFSDNFNWSADGWLKDTDGVTMLHMTNGNRLDIPFYLFKGDNVDPTKATNYIIRNYGRTIEVEFRVSNALAYGADVRAISCWNGDIGFYITPTKIVFQNSAGASTSLTTDFLEGDRVRVGLVFQTTASGRGMFLYLNGKQTGYFTYDDAHSFQQPAPVGITVDSSLCDVDIYRVMVYNSALSKTQMVNNYIVGLDSVARMVEVYDRNDIFYNNLISYTKAQEHVPVMIFTGEGIEDYMNVPVANKSMKINVAVEYIDAAAPEKSFTATGVQVKFQGTSSMAYPVRNFKIKTAKGAIEGDPAYTDTAKGLYKLRPESCPVNCWCLKADFAESSGVHNTGAAKLLNDVLTRATDNSGNRVYMTPPQRAYTGDLDIRTTVDGFPILLFRRERASDTPIFVGKYNFNNDKSTQAVFGFEDIPGFSDTLVNRTQSLAAEDDYRLPDGSINPDSRVNPCECWEFCSNDVDLCKFKFNREEDMDAETMLMAFESRYPEVYGDDTDYATSPWGYWELKKVLRWVHSTDTSLVDDDAPAALAEPVTYGGVTYDHDTRAYRLAKFRAEVSLHFNLDNLLAYFVLTDFLGAVDQRAKNQMMASWGNEGAGDFKWYFIFYDNDTILGLNNSGLIRYDYDLEADTPNAYSGKDSVLWLNIEAAFAAELATCWQRLAKAAKGTQNILSYEGLIHYFNTEQSDMWSESVFNEDSTNKYIKQGGSAVPDVKYYPVLQGSREDHRKYWIANRLEWINGKYKADSFVSKSCYWRSNRGPNCQLSFAITGDRKQYYGYLVGTAWMEVFRLDADTPRDILYTGGWDYSDTYVFGYSHITDLGDMSPMYPSEMVISQLGRLKRLVVSSEAHRNTFLDLLDLQNKPYLEHLDIRYAANLSAVSNLENCPRLRTLLADHSGLRGVKFADGGLLETVSLPATLTSLDMRNLTSLTTAGFSAEGLGAITDLLIDNCPQLAVLGILNMVAGNEGLNSVRLLNINDTTTYASGTLATLLALHNNPDIDTKFTGRIVVDRIGNYQLGLLEKIEGLTIVCGSIVEDVTISVSGARNIKEGETLTLSPAVSGDISGGPAWVGFVWELRSQNGNVQVNTETGDVKTTVRADNVNYTDTVTIRASLNVSKYVYKDVTFTVQGIAVTGMAVYSDDDVSTASGLPLDVLLEGGLLPTSTTKHVEAGQFTFGKPADAAYGGLYSVAGDILSITGNNGGREFEVVATGSVTIDGQTFTARKTILVDVVHVGDFVYSDGSTSASYIASKQLVGVCFYLNADRTDRRMVAAKNGSKTAVWGSDNSLDQMENPAPYALWQHELLNIDAPFNASGNDPDALLLTSKLRNWQSTHSGNPQDYRKRPIGTFPTSEANRETARCYSVWGNMEGRQETDAMLYWREQNGYTQLESAADVNTSDLKQYPSAALAALYGDDAWAAGKKGSWYLPSSGELTLIYKNLKYNSTAYARLAALPSSAFDSIAGLIAQCSTVGHNGICQVYLLFNTGELGSDWGYRKATARTLRFVTSF